MAWHWNSACAGAAAAAAITRNAKMVATIPDIRTLPPLFGGAGGRSLLGGPDGLGLSLGSNASGLRFLGQPPFLRNPSRLCLGRELGFHRDPPRLGLGSEPFLFGFLGGSGLLGNPELFGREAGFLVPAPLFCLLGQPLLHLDPSGLGLFGEPLLLGDSLSFSRLGCPLLLEHPGSARSSGCRATSYNTRQAAELGDNMNDRGQRN